MITDRTALSRTRAMMAANALRKSAQETLDSSALLQSEGMASQAASLARLAEWYGEVAEALDRLDDDGTPIYPEDTAGGV